MIADTQRFTFAAELHRRLVELDNFDFRPDGRDFALYQQIKVALNLPDGQFLQALELLGTSAAEYLQAMMQAAAPFSSMYRDLLEYCEKSGTQRSELGAEVEWSMKSDGEVVPISLEHLRIYERIESQVLPDLKKWGDAKNEIMEWLSKRALPETAYGMSYPHDWDEVEIFRILRQARERMPDGSKAVFGGLSRVYLDPKGGRPPTDLRSRVQEHPEYAAMLALVRGTFGATTIETLATDFVGLPLWRYRWQVYELWVLCAVLRQLKPLGFELQPSSDGSSLLELGRENVVARHPGTKGMVVCQPSYNIDDGRGVKPDVVVTFTADVMPEQVGLVVEAKQRGSIAQGHVDDVVDRYGRAVSAKDGTVIIVNYDAIGSCRSRNPEKVALLGDVVPGSAGEQALLYLIARSAVARSLRQEVWYVDVSQSMATFVTSMFRQQLGERGQIAASVTVFSFASEVTPVQPDDLCANIGLSASLSDPEWEGHGIKALLCHIEQQRATKPTAQILVVTDLAGSGEWGHLPERLGLDVLLLHPKAVDFNRMAS